MGVRGTEVVVQGDVLRGDLRAPIILPSIWLFPLTSRHKDLEQEAEEIAADE